MTNRPFKLRAALGNSRYVAPIKDGSVSIPGVELDLVDNNDQVDIWRTMARTLEFDVSLMSVVSFLCAKEYGIPFSCLPLCLNAGFHHGDFMYNVKSGIKEPKDLEGEKVGTRTWTVTPGTLDRGILSDEFGVDLSKVTFVLAEQEHVPQAQAHLPPNVIPGVGTGEDLFPRLVSGELQAGMAGANLRRSEHPDIQPLFPNAVDLDRAYYQRTGIIQPFVIIAIKDSVLAQAPWLLEEFYAAFKEAKAKAGVQTDPVLKSIIGDADPVPFGREANRKGFEEAIRIAHENNIISKRFAVEDIFPAFD
jgi:4,5-dihydroxyphthalate decarboxylase